MRGSVESPFEAQLQETVAMELNTGGRPVGANFWAKHAKNYATMSNAHITYTIAHCTTTNVFLTLVLVTHC